MLFMHPWQFIVFTAYLALCVFTYFSSAILFSLAGKFRRLRENPSLCDGGALGLIRPAYRFMQAFTRYVANQDENRFSEERFPESISR